jgi:short-subunit dehydrogenase
MSANEMLQGFNALIITGASSGIGKSFLEHAHSLNPELHFFNLSRTKPAGLKSAELEHKLRHLECDFSDRTALDKAAERLVSELQEIHASGRILLINNSGYGTYGDFPKPNVVRNLQMLDVNLRAPMLLTDHLMPMLRERGGAVVNIASTAAFQPMPGMAVYGASKAFLLHWSLALGEELRGSGVQVLAVCPGPTSTSFFRNAGLEKQILPDSLGQEPMDVVRTTWRALASGKGMVVSGWQNKLTAFFASKLPKVLATRLAGRVVRHFRPVE